VVEDDPDVLQILTSLLADQAQRLEVETEMDGYDALIKVGTFKPSFLILDVIMPKLDGLEVCRRLKAGPETRDIKILAVTGHAGMAERVVAAGADACVTKPFDFGLMSKELERFLSSPGREPAMRRPG
jgi:CheY-like chemotaxis protein